MHYASWLIKNQAQIDLGNCILIKNFKNFLNRFSISKAVLMNALAWFFFSGHV